MIWFNVTKIFPGSITESLPTQKPYLPQCSYDLGYRPGLHNIRPAGHMRPGKSFLLARENSVAENVAKARLRIITCPFRISSTLRRNRHLRPAASLRWSIWPFELSELCRPAIDYARKAYVCTIFENFSNRPLWKLDEIVKKITRKMNALSKTVFKMFFENPVPLNMRLRTQPRFVTVDKMAGIFTKRMWQL